MIKETFTMTSQLFDEMVAGTGMLDGLSKEEQLKCKLMLISKANITPEQIVKVAKYITSKSGINTNYERLLSVLRGYCVSTIYEY